MILVLVLDPFNVMDADQLCWLLERGGKETYSLVDGFNLLSGKIWKLNLDGLEISPGKNNYILQSTHPRRSISVMQGVGKNVLFTVLCECGKKVSSRQELGMINYTGTSLPSTASLLSFQGAMRSKGVVQVLGWAGCYPEQAPNPSSFCLSTKGSDYGSCAHCLLLVPLENYLHPPQEATAKEQGPGKEEPETCHHHNVCSCLALGRWAGLHNIWRKSGKFWHPAHCPAHRGTGTELLHCCFSK